MRKTKTTSRKRNNLGPGRRSRTGRGRHRRAGQPAAHDVPAHPPTRTSNGARRRARRSGCAGQHIIEGRDVPTARWSAMAPTIRWMKDCEPSNLMEGANAAGKERVNKLHQRLYGADAPWRREAAKGRREGSRGAGEAARGRKTGRAGQPRAGGGEWKGWKGRPNPSVEYRLPAATPRSGDDVGGTPVIPVHGPPRVNQDQVRPERPARGATANLRLNLGGRRFGPGKPRGNSSLRRGRRHAVRSFFSRSTRMARYRLLRAQYLPGDSMLHGDFRERVSRQAGRRSSATERRTEIAVAEHRRWSPRRRGPRDDRKGAHAARTDAGVIEPVDALPLDSYDAGVHSRQQQAAHHAKAARRPGEGREMTRLLGATAGAAAGRGFRAGCGAADGRHKGCADLWADDHHIRQGTARRAMSPAR